MTRRLVPAAALAIAGLVLAAATAVAGGWALIQPDPGEPPQPSAGEEVSLGFSVLQHGVTPVSWPTATLIARNADTGRSVSVTARAEGEPGHYVATLAFPESGFWTWHVELADLIAESPPSVLTVLNADGSAPSLGTSALLAAIERARESAVREAGENFSPGLEETMMRLDAARTEIAVMKGTIGQLEDSRDRLQARVDELEAGGAGGAMSPLAAITLGLLAGAAGGFAMVALGRRGDAREGVPATPGYVATTR